MNHPKFIIIGAAKCGTTSLFQQLSKHPEVFAPSVKEPGYFIRNHHLSSIRTEEEYNDLFKGAEGYVTSGEATVSYMADPVSPGLIHNYLGDDVKIIAILRNPIDMAYSLWKHRRRELNEDLGFFDAIEKWEERKNDAEFTGNSVDIDWDYLGRAKFYEQLERYKRFKNLKVLIFEEYVRNSKEEFNEICRFLGISEELDIEFESANTSFSPKSKSLQRALMHPSRFKDILKKVIPVKKLVPIKNYVESLNKSKDNTPPLTEDQRLKLKLMLEDDVRRLEKFLGKDLGFYWNDFK